MANRTLAAILLGAAGGMSNLASSLRYNKEKADEEAQQQLARQDRLSAFSESARHNQAIEALQQAQVDAQKAANDRLIQQEADRQKAEAIDRALAAGKAIDFIPDNPSGWAAAQGLGAAYPMPIEEDMTAARGLSNATRTNIRIPGQGTVVYDPKYMSGMNTWMGNQNRPASGTPDRYRDRVTTLRMLVDQAAKQWEQLYPIPAKVGGSPEEMAALEDMKRKALMTNAAALGVGIDSNGNFYDLWAGSDPEQSPGTHQPRPAPPGSGRRRPTSAQMFPSPNAAQNPDDAPAGPPRDFSPEDFN